MKGRLVSWALLAVLVLALGVQTMRLRDRLRASQMLKAVEVTTSAAMAVGRLSTPLLLHNAEVMRRAARLDPLDARIPLARGGQYLLLRQPASAIAAYRQALAIEPRPEIYLNLGRAQLSAGQDEEARRSFETTIALDPHLTREVAAEAR